MDVNGTRLHLVLTGEDWARFAMSGATYTPERGGVTFVSRALRAPGRDDGVGVDVQARRGAATDRYGHWYWIDPDENGVPTIWFAPKVGEAGQRFWPRPDLEPFCPPTEGDFDSVLPEGAPARPALRGLCVTCDHHLVVGTLAPGGLLVFDLHAGGPPLELRWPIEFHPFDLAVRPGGGFVVLERAPDGPRLWTLDGHFRVVPPSGPDAILSPARVEDFRPGCGPSVTTPERVFAEGVDLGMATPLPGFEAMAVEVLSDDSVLVLVDEGLSSTVHRYVAGAPAGVPVPLFDALAHLIEPTSPPDPLQASLRAQDFAFTPERIAGLPDAIGRLYFAVPDTRQAFAFAVLTSQAGGWSLSPLASYLPLRRFGRRALVAAGVDVFYDDEDARWLPLSRIPKPRYALEARITGPTMPDGVGFDGRTPGCVWHRLFIDGCIPEGCEVVVETRAHDERERLAEQAWSREPELYLRGTGSELPYTGVVGGARGQREGTWELLFQRAQGRFLELRFRFTASGRVTPTLRALRVHYPRFSYLERYLPAVYRNEEASASFMDRYLSNVEGMLTELEGRIAQAQALFDPRTVPGELLEWLASWLGAFLDPSWTEAHQRLFIENAVALFRERGTVGGLERLATLAASETPCPELFEAPAEPASRRGRPRVVERFLTRSRRGLATFDPSQAAVRPPVAPTDPWLPSHGADALLARFRAFVRARYEDDVDRLSFAWGARMARFDDVRFSAVEPRSAAKARDRRDFLNANITFDYAPVAAADVVTYRSFLMSRYGTSEGLVEAYGLTPGEDGATLQTIPLPAEDDFLPDGVALDDWIHFVSVVLPAAQAAHRFTVLVPASPGEPDEVLSKRMSRVRAVVEREKPGHTDFDIRLFWDLFRVGYARLGIDNELGAGSRFYALVLDESHLAETFVPEAYPASERDRLVLGRDPVERTPPLS
ncbi:MAG: hypothetical protein H6730_17720 [Deltaproteobacteria bacterium]|nr:hypothetical protein [Deltaproteobacteria bacterium]